MILLTIGRLTPSRGVDNSPGGQGAKTATGQAHRGDGI